MKIFLWKIILILADSASGTILASSCAPKTDVLLPIIKRPIKKTIKIDDLITKCDRYSHNKKLVLIHNSGVQLKK